MYSELVHVPGRETGFCRNRYSGKDLPGAGGYNVVRRSHKSSSEGQVPKISGVTGDFEYYVGAGK